MLLAEQGTMVHFSLRLSIAHTGPLSDGKVAVPDALVVSMWP